MSRQAASTEPARDPVKNGLLLGNIIDVFVACFAPEGQIIHLGGAGHELVDFDQCHFADLGVPMGQQDKLPDILIHHPQKNRLFLVEDGIRHGPINAERHNELKQLFANSKAFIIYVTAFPDRSTMRKYLADIAWETEVWVADSPSHLIHFNGDKFLGPYSHPPSA